MKKNMQKRLMLLGILTAVLLMGFSTADSSYATDMTGAWSPSGGGDYSSTAGPTTVTASVSTANGGSWENVGTGTTSNTNYYSNSSATNHQSLQSDFDWDDDGDGTGTLTFKFNRNVTNPVLHLDRLGGVGGGQANSALFTLTSGQTLVKLSGTNHLIVTSNTFYRTPNVPSSGSEANWNSNSGTAAGSIQIMGTFDTVTFTWARTGPTGAGGDAIEFVWELPSAASIGNYVWSDVDGDGRQDGGENGIAGVVVNLYNNAGTQIATTTTNGAGSYQFTNLNAGTYSLGFVLPSGYAFSPQDQASGDDTRDSDANIANGRTITTTLVAGESDTTWDAGMYQLARIGDRVWNDLDADGRQDGGESGVAGVVVNLYNSAGIIIATTTTNGAGNYQFTNLVPGTYSLGFVLPSGYAFSPQNVGNDNQDSDANPANGRTSTTTLSVGETDNNWDAGIYDVDYLPVANDDTVSVNEDNLLNGNAASNDVASLDGGNVWSVTVQPSHGTVTMNSNGVYTYTPTANYNGADQFTYRIRDADGDIDTAIVYITVNSVDDFPVANDDSASVNEDSSIVNGNVAGNDLPSGDGGNVWSVTVQPIHGTVSMNSNGIYTYTPTANYNGADQFTYRIIDVDGDIDTAVVYITVNPVNDAPVANDDTANTNEDTPANINVIANDSDIDGDTLSVTGVTQPANGVVVNNGDGTVTYTPDSDWSGVDTFTYTISDGHGGTDTATVTVTVNAVNDAPVAVDDSDNTNEDTPVTVSVLTNDSDVEGDTLTVTGVTQPAHGTVVNNGDGTVTYTPDSDWNGVDTFTYTISDGNGGSDTATVTVTVNPMNDAPVAVDNTVSTPEDTTSGFDVLGNDYDVDGDSLTITGVTQPAHGQVVNYGTYVAYTPDSNYNGPDQFTYTISDGNGGTATATVYVTVTPVNDPPVAVDDTASTDEDTSVVIPVLDNDYDEENDSVTVTVTQPAHGTVVVNGDGTVTYTPDSAWNGVDTFTYTIDDGNGGTDTATVTVNVASVPDADLALTKKVDKTKPTVKDTVIFTLIVNNYGPETAVEVTVYDKLPAGLTYVSSTANYGTYDPDTGIWTIGSLPNGESAVLTITSVVEESGQIINEANVTALSWDPNLDDNTASAVLDVPEEVEPEPVPVEAKTVAMQKTGAPIGALLVALFMLLAGMVLPRRK